ncbi:MAG: hypothetical protein C5B49_00700 [Bdellovibrio sp.]|nr:MAG: hypothetical protein C5B49_00700 [Bdellovibrio sp.]
MAPIILRFLIIFSSSVALAGLPEVSCFKVNRPAPEPGTLQSAQALIVRTLNSAALLEAWRTLFEIRSPLFVAALFDIFADSENGLTVDSVVLRDHLYSQLVERTKLKRSTVDVYVNILISNKVLDVDFEAYKAKGKNQDRIILKKYGIQQFLAVGETLLGKRPDLPLRELNSLLNAETEKAFQVVRAWAKVFGFSPRLSGTLSRFPLAVLEVFTDVRGQIREEVDRQILISEIELSTEYEPSSILNYLLGFTHTGLLKAIPRDQGGERKTVLVLTSAGRKKYGEVEAAMKQSNP